MNPSNKVLSKAVMSWADVHKQLLIVIQTRGTSIHTSSSTTHQLPINKVFVKQCTDLLIKHIKNLSQAQVIEQLENLAQSCNLGVFKTPSEEDPNTVNAFLSTDDFFFEVSVNLEGEITEVKFSIFSEPAKRSPLLKEIFCSWNWDSLAKHIEGIKQNYILAHSDHQIRAKGYKAIECLENDLDSLYQIELKYLEKTFKNMPKMNGHGSQYQSKFIDRLVNQSPIGVLKKSELGEPMRLYYYLSPLDLIEHHKTDKLASYRADGFDATYKILSSLKIDQLVEHEIGSYATISLLSTDATAVPDAANTKNYYLPDGSLLILNDINDDRSLSDAFTPFFNTNFNFDKVPLFQKMATTYSSHNYTYKQETRTLTGIEIPGTYQVKLNKPLVMCQSTLQQMQTQIGIEMTSDIASNKPTPFFELLAKTSINNKVLNDAYSVQLPDENQVYYITELDQPNCLGILVDKILFTHPQDLVVIIETIRKQLFFNELLLSCMKTLCSSASSLNNNYNTTNLNYVDGNELNEKHVNVRILEIGLLAPYVVSVIMQHPKLLCYTTIEIDLSSGNVETRFRDHNDLHNPNVISEIIRRCHSIPVTIRALLMKYKQAQLSGLKRSLNSEPDNSDNNGNNSNNQNGKNNNNMDRNSNQNNTDSFNNFNGAGGASDYSLDRGYMAKQSTINGSISDDESQDEPQANVTPLSLPGHHNRLTPSRRDSYRTNSTSSSSSCGIKTPNVSTSIFDFSNSISEQKRTDELRLDKKLEEHKKQQQQPRQDTIKPVVKKAPKLEKTPKIENSQFELSCDQEIIDTLKKADQDSSSSKSITKIDERSSSAKSDKNLSFQTPNLPVNTKKSTLKTKGSMDSPSPSPVSNSSSTTPLVNKKRKAPSNSESSSTPSSFVSSAQAPQCSQSVNSTPTNTLHPPSAKRKMTQSSTPGDFKRHTSLIENEPSSKTSSGSSSSSSSNGKKLKLKSSASSVELSSTVKSSENVKRSENSKSLSGTKKESVLTAVVNSNQASQSSKLLSKSSSSSKNNSNSQNKQKTNSTPSPLNPKDSSSKTSTPNIKSKSQLSDKSKQESNKSRSSSSLANKTNNLSATEMALKHPNSSSSPVVTSNSITSVTNTSTPGLLGHDISKNLSSARTPSPLSVSTLSSLATPSPVPSEDLSEHSETSSTNTNNASTNSTRSETSTKTKLKQRSNNSDSSSSSSSSSSGLKHSSTLVSPKPNTPPLTSEKKEKETSLASFALGLGSKFKATSFKIPHKAKKDTPDEDDPPVKSSLSVIPTASSSTKVAIGSPNKSNTSQADSKGKSSLNRNIMPPPPPLGSKNNPSNSSPKWQANYSGNMSPRYSNESSSSNSPRNGNNPSKNDNSKSLIKGNHQQQRVAPASNRPVTPIPPNQNSRNRNLSNKPQIMPLMSFNSGSINSNFSQETPSSPPMTMDAIESPLPTKLIPIIPDTKPIITATTPLEPEPSKPSHSASPTPAPPDSPTSETIPVFVPKVIPLERNFTSEAPIKEQVKNVTKKSNSMTTSKLKSVDIASPDAVVEDNLIIDLPNHNTCINKREIGLDLKII